MSILAIELAAVAILVASALIGGALWTWSGARTGGWLAPAVGFATLLVLVGLTVRLPGGAATAARGAGSAPRRGLGGLPVRRRGGAAPAAGAAVAATVVAAVALHRTGAAREARPAALRLGLPIAVVVLVLVSLPFAVSGRTGLLGVGNDNDSVPHLLAAWSLLHGAAAHHELLDNGYPFGPHALLAALSAVTGISLPHALTGLILTIPVLTAWAAVAALDRGRRVARLAVAVLVGLPYLAASYLAQGAFKETTLALFVLAFALAARELARDRGGRAARRALPIALLTAGSIYTYSYLGGIWMLATLGAWLALAVLRAGWRAPWRAIRDRVLGAAPLLGWGLVTLTVLCAFEIPRMVRFADSPYNQAPTQNTGNLVTPIPARQALGVWLTPDFRFSQPSSALTAALVALALVAALAAVAWWIRRRELAVPAALAGALLVYWQASVLKNPYDAAKGLVILAPLVALLVGRATLGAWAARHVRAPRPGVRMGGALAGSLGAIVLAAAACSSFLALRDAPVGPRAHADQLARLRTMIDGRPTLFLVNDDFADWELRGVPVSRPRLLYPTSTVPLRPGRHWQPGDPFDFDSVDAAVLDRFRYTITSRTPYASSSPPNWRLAAQTGSYRLWRRTGPTPPGRIPLAPHRGPGRVLDCQTTTGSAVSSRVGEAWVTPRPVVGRARGWHGTVRLAGHAATQVLDLPAGDWDLSLQYVGRQGLDLSAPGLRRELPPSLDRIGAYWYAGTLHVAHGGPVRITVRSRPLGLVGRILGAPGKTYALNSPPGRPLGSYGPIDRPLGALAATRHGAAGRLVPLDQACGRYVDWYRLAPGPGSFTVDRGAAPARPERPPGS